ncbi:hypothetical protein D3C84_899740 [compost metagenome]
MSPQIVSDRAHRELQVGLVDGGVAPARQRITALVFMPGHGVEATVEVGEKVASFLMIDEPAEERLISRRAQFAGQLGHERQGVRVLFERVFRVVGDVDDDPRPLGGEVKSRRENDDAGQQ